MGRHRERVMAKRDRDESLRAGEALLESWGVAGDAAPSALTASMGRDVAADLAIAQRLGALPGDESVALLQKLEAASADKLVHKEVKRALYRLEQRGVAVPAAPTPAAVGPIVPAAIEGYLSPIDGHGDQLVWLVKPRSGGVLHLFAVINDPEGMRETDLTVVTRKALKAVRGELQAKHELTLVPADWRYCDFLMRRAFAWARAREARIEGDYPALRAQLVHEPGLEEMPPLILAHVDAAALTADDDRLAQSGTLIEQKEFRTWVFTPEQLKPYLDELAAIRDSPLVLDRAQQEERFRSVIDGAVERLFGGAPRDSWVRWLYETAYVFWSTGRREPARMAVTVAAALARSAHGGRGIPFCEHLARGSLALYFQAAAEQEAERSQSSLIVTPQQLRAQRERR